MLIFQLSDLQRQPAQVRERSMSDGSQQGDNTNNYYICLKKRICWCMTLTYL